MKKSEKKYLYWFFGAIGLIFIYNLFSKKNNSGSSLVTPVNNDWSPIPINPPFKSPDTVNKGNALHWNNPTGIIKIPNIWVCYGEIQDTTNTSQFKAFDTIENGFAAQLYLLLTYIKNGNNTVSGIVKMWTGLKETEPYYKTYIRLLGFKPTDKIDNLEKLKQFASNQAYAETQGNPNFYKDIFLTSMFRVAQCDKSLVLMLPP